MGIKADDIIELIMNKSYAISLLENDDAEMAYFEALKSLVKNRPALSAEAMDIISQFMSIPFMMKG